MQHCRKQRGGIPMAEPCRVHEQLLVSLFMGEVQDDVGRGAQCVALLRVNLVWVLPFGRASHAARRTSSASAR